MHPAVAYSATPNLDVWVAGQQALRSRQGVLSHFERPGLYIDGHDFPLIVGLDV